MLSRLPVYPVAFAVAFVLNRYLATGGYLNVVVRPLLALVAVAILVQLVLWLITRNRHVGGVLATAVLATILDPVVAVVTFATGCVVLILGATPRSRAGPLDWGRLTQVFNAIAVATVVVSAVLIGLRGTVTLAPAAAAAGVAAPGTPDIYLILLDAYPRTDSLASYFGFDNRPFIGELERLGFEEAKDSHSNYNATSLTLASMFNARQVPALLGDRADATVVTSARLQRLANAGTALTWLRQAGYRLVSMPSGVTSADLVAVDHVIDPGQVNSFEVSVMEAGLLPRLSSSLEADWIYDQQRDRIQATFEALAAMAASADARPRFVFAHVMSPHVPILFDAAGMSVRPPACFPVRCGPWDGSAETPAVVDQIRFLNTLILDTVSKIVSKSPRPPVVVIMSDHGSRYFDRDEMLRNLFIASTPGHPGVFPDDATPINLIPRLLNAYTDAGIPLATRESYVVDLSSVPAKGYLPLVPSPQT